MLIIKGVNVNVLLTAVVVQCTGRHVQSSETETKIVKRAYMRVCVVVSRSMFSFLFTVLLSCLCICAMERSADHHIHTTEWEDIQYKYGNRVGKYATQELEILAQKIAVKSGDMCLEAYDPDRERRDAKLERRGPGSDADEEAFNNSSDSDEDIALEAIRRHRIVELQKQAATEHFGVLRHVPGKDYVKEVTDASEKNWVVAVLVIPGHSDCEALLNVFRTVATRHREVKFVSMISTEAIVSFPDRHLPCALLYKDRTLRHQVSGLSAWTNQKEFSVKTVESVLMSRGVLPSQSESDCDSAE